MKIVINRCYGGFGLSSSAVKEYLKLKGKKCFFYKEDYVNKIWNQVSDDSASNYDNTLTKDYGASFKYDWYLIKDDYFYYGNIERTDEDLIKVVETLGSEKASGHLSRLQIIELPDDVVWELDEYDGIETVREVHRSW